MYKDINNTVTLMNGVKMPILGLGVFRVDNEEDISTSINAALEAGYKHIDTAAAYDNEDMVGKVIAKYGKREDIFITTKLANNSHKDAERAFEESLEKLGTDYIDLYLIHWPCPARNNYIDAWKSLVGLLEDGRAKAIGVSNFTPEYIERLADATGVMPMVNQVERHPLFQQKDLKEYCKKNNIITQAYAPLTSGRLSDLSIPLKPIAEKYDKTVAQIILRWHIQTDWIIIPKSITPSRIQENANIFDFQLDEGDLSIIEDLNTDNRLFPNPEEMNRD